MGLLALRNLPPQRMTSILTHCRTTSPNPRQCWPSQLLAAAKLLGKQPELKANFSRVNSAVSQAKKDKVARFLPNPEANWGPKAKHGRQLKPQQQGGGKGGSGAGEKVVQEEKGGAVALEAGQEQEDAPQQEQQGQQGEGQQQEQEQQQQQREGEGEPMLQ